MLFLTSRFRQFPIGILFFCFLLHASRLSAQQPKVGESVEGLTFSELVNDLESQTTQEDYRGKMLILDFWATWCGPCVQDLPKMAALQQEFGEDLKILAITDESPERIALFLEKRPQAPAIVLDLDGKLAERFPHRMIPHTVILNAEHELVAITSASQITAEVIGEILKGNIPELEWKNDLLEFDPEALLSEQGSALMQFSLTPYLEGAPSFSSTFNGPGAYQGRRLKAVNLSTKTLLEFVYRFPAGTRTSVEVENPAALKWSRQTSLCFDLILPEELSSERFTLAQTLLENYFGYRVTLEKRVVSALVLSKIETVPFPAALPEDTTLDYSSSGRGMEMTSGPIRVLSEFLEDRMQIPVLDETGLEGFYSLNVPWYTEQEERIYSDLEKIGLKLEKADREVIFLVIRDK